MKEHVSVYLALADSTSLGPGWEVSAVFRLYLLDQNKDSYLILQGRCVVSNLFSLLEVPFLSYACISCCRERETVPYVQT